MKLNTESAVTQLSIIADEIILEIKKSKDNEVIKNSLELLDACIYKIADQALNVTTYIIKNERPNKTKKESNRFGIFWQTTHKELVIKCCDLLQQIRYYKPKEVLELAVFIQRTDYSKWDESSSSKRKDAKKEAMDLIEKLVKYNTHAINQIGISTQRIILDTIKKWSHKKKLDNVEILSRITSFILSPSVEGFEMTGPETFTHTSGALVPDKHVEKLRKDAIDLIFSIYPKVKNLKDKIQLIAALHEAMRTPMNAIKQEVYDKIQEMTLTDTKYIIKKYKQILFTNNKLTVDFPTVKEIESQFLTFEINEANYKEKIPEVWKFLRLIRSDKEYGIYRSIVEEHGDFHTSRSTPKKRGSIKDEMEYLAKSISKKNLEEWLKRIKVIAKYATEADGREEWKYNHFRQLLVHIAHYQSKPVVENLFEEALKKNNSLQKFVFELMWGLRCRKDLILWDKYQDILIQKHKGSLSAIFGSLQLMQASSFRKKDVQLIKDIAEEKGIFSKLNKKVKQERNLRIFVFLCLLKLLEVSPKEANKLLQEEMKKYPDLLYTHINRLESYLFRDKKTVTKLSETFKKFVYSKIVEIERIEFNSEILLQELSGGDPAIVLGIFQRRIEKSLQKPSRWDSDDRYEAIPYDINAELVDAVTAHQDYAKVIQDVINKYSGKKKSTLYEYEIGRLLRSFPSPSNKEVILSYIKKGTQKDLKTALNLMNNFASGAPDFDLCIEFVKQADPKKYKELLQELSGIMGNTGVVSGWDGLARAYQGKAEQLRKLADQNQEKKVKDFCNDLAKHFETRSKQEKKRAQEEKKLREIEFES